MHMKIAASVAMCALATMALVLGTGVKLFDVTGSTTDTNGDMCSYAIDSTRIPTGTASGKGVCGGGTDPGGFELVVNGALSLSRTCATVDTVAVTLAGTVAVAGS